MKVHTNGFKTNISLFGRQLSSKITYELEGETIELGNEELNSVVPHYNSDILKSTMKQLDIDSNIEIPKGTILNYQFGVLVNDNYEYLNYGNYIVDSCEIQEDTRSYKIICYDKMLYSMKDYEQFNFIYPISIRAFITSLCQHLNLTFANAQDTFANYDQEIPNELYVGIGYTYRDVFDELAQVTGSNICINEDDEVEIRYVNDTNDIIDEEFLKDVNVNFGEKFGPVNSIVLTRADEADSIFLQDEESVEQNGLCEIKISENQIMNFNDRDKFLPDLLQQLDGLEYYINDFTSTGIAYYDVYDKYGIRVGDKVYYCLMLNDEAPHKAGFCENIFTEMPTYSKTDYTKADKTDRRINQTYIIANKQTGEIEALTTRLTVVEQNSVDTYSKEQINQLIQNAETGLTNTFIETGGNNIFRNTGLWFENANDNINPYEFWEGNVLKGSNEDSTSKNSMILQSGALSQSEIVNNDVYTVSFYYKKLIPLAEVKVIINDVEYELTETNKTQFYTGKQDFDGNYIINPLEVSANNIKIEFVSDTNNACEIWDLMVNKGPRKSTWSQHQNETTTDTVNISKGITITSSDTDVSFKANADGIRTLDSRGNVLTRFTDKGMTTKEAVIENEATIVGILRQRVDNQIWDSFIG